MKVMKVISFVLGIAVVLCGSTATANLLNGGFESGDLSGWNATGKTQAVQWETPRDMLGLVQPPDTVDADGNPEWQPNEGNWFASLWSTDNDWGAPSGPSTLSTLTRTFTVVDAPGLAVEFDYFYDYGDYIPLGEDPARIYVEDTSPSSTWLGWEMTINNSLASPPTGLDADVNIGWTRMSVDLPGAGTYKLGFEINDPVVEFESFLGVDNAQVVPVPGAVLLGAIGLGVANWRLRRRRMS